MLSIFTLKIDLNSFTTGHRGKENESRGSQTEDAHTQETEDMQEVKRNLEGKKHKIGFFGIIFLKMQFVTSYVVCKRIPTALLMCFLVSET